AAVVDAALGGRDGELPGLGAAAGARRVEGGLPDASQLRRYLVRQHLLEAEAEEVLRIPAVGSGGHVAPEARGPARPSVTAGAAVREAGADGEDGVDVAGAVALDGPLPQLARELALEDLAAAADGAGRIAV